MKFSESQQDLVESIENEITKLAHKWEKFLRSKGIVSPELPGDEVRLSKVRKYKEAFWLHLIHHFIEDEEIRWTVKVQLLDIQKQFGQEEQEKLSFILQSRAQAILFILETTTFRNPREFFGFLLSRELEVTRYSLYISHRRKAHRVPRRRGYNDHGSMKPTHKWTESSDITLTELQQELEEKRKIIKDTYYLLEGGTL